MAANSIAKLAVLITGDASPLRASLQNAGQAVQQFAGSFGGGAGGMAGMAAMAAPIAAVGAAVTAAGAALIAFGKAGIEAASSMEQARISFEVMTGSAATALGMINDLRALAAESPMNFTDIQQAAKILLAMGEDSRLVVDEIEMLGHVSAGSGQRLTELAQVFGQVMQAGRLTGNELRQFNERGVPLLTTLAQQMGVTKQEIREMVEAGTLSSDQVVAAFQKMTSEGGLFANMMGRQADTLSGQWEKFKENLTIIASETMKNFSVVLTDILRDLNAILDTIVRWYGIERERNTTNTESLRNQIALENKRAQEAKQHAEEEAKAAKEELKVIEEKQRRADAIAKGLRTPQEIYADTVKELRALAGEGFLSPDSFRRGIDRALKDFEDANKKKKEIENQVDTRVGALERFTMAGYSAVTRAGEQKKLEDNTKKTADNTGRTVTQLSGIFEAMRGLSLGMDNLKVSNF